MPSTDRVRHRPLTVAVVVVVATLVLFAGIQWRVTDLRTRATEVTRRQLASSAAAAAHAIEAWYAERTADAAVLGEVAAIHAADPSARRPGSGQTLIRQMHAVKRRYDYYAVWMLTDSARPIAAVDRNALTPGERAAARRAMATRSVQATSAERQGGDSVSISVAAPVYAIPGDPFSPTGHVDGAVVLRADLSRAFVPLRQPSTTAPLIAVVIPTDSGAVEVATCSPPGNRICLEPLADPASRRALSGRDTSGVFTEPGHPDLLVATHKMISPPWAMVMRVDRAEALAGFRRELLVEGGVVLGLVTIVALVAYGYTRDVRLRRLAERTQAEAERLRTHEQLRGSEARFKAVVESLDDMVLTIDCDRRITGASGRGFERVHLTAESLLGRTLSEAFGAAATAPHDEVLSRGFAGERLGYEWIGRAAGKGRYYSSTVAPLRDGDGPVTEIVLLTRETTTAMRAEASSEWQRGILEDIATGVALHDVLATVARFSESQCPGSHCVVHLLDDDGILLRVAAAPSIPRAFAEAIDEVVIGPGAPAWGEAAFNRVPVLSSDIAGDPLWASYRALALDSGLRACWVLPIGSRQGRVLGSIALYSEASREPTADELRTAATAAQLARVAIDRSRAADSLSQSEASFRSFVENSPIGIYRATAQGRVLAVNSSLVQMLGYESAAEVLQLDLARDVYATPTDRGRLLRELDAHGGIYSAETEWRRRDGSVLAVRISARAYRNEPGAVLTSEGFVEDVTPLRSAEQALRHSEKLAAIGQLVSGVAHELNNPMGAILHFAEDLLEDERPMADREALIVIRDQARRSRAIVRDLLSFVRIRSESRERVVITDALQATSTALRPAVEALGVDLVMSLPDSSIASMTDRAGLGQVLTNLVMNAAQAAGRGGTVTVTASIGPREATVIVDDTGPGIPPEIRDRIFEPFFTTKPLGEGTGLGLSVTLGIVEQLGGRITVENRPARQGNGARFAVVLPLDDDGEAPPDRLRSVAATSRVEPAARASTPAPTSRTAPEPEPGAPHVLIIDDEPAIRTALNRFFSRRGWQVTEVGDGAAALATLTVPTAHFTAIISDLRMPGCSGIELHDHLAAIRPAILERMIFSTGDVVSDEAAEFVRRTRCTVLQKPFELHTLERAVEALRHTPAT